MSPQMTAVEQYIRDQFAGAFAGLPKEVSIATSSTSIVPNNFERLGLVLVNLGSYNVYVKPASDVTTTSGILLAKLGGFISMNVRDDLVLPAYSWYGIADGGASDIFVVEVNRYQAISLTSKT